MKKKISTFFLLCFVLTCFMSFSAHAADLKQSDIAKEAGLLQAIDIISSAADETEGNSPITRAEFATILGKTLKVGGETSDTRYFTDVPMNHWALGYINALTEKNIISAAEDKLFRPNDKITVDEAVKLLVSGLGYGVIADGAGGYPTGYRSIAKQCDFRIYGGTEPLTLYRSYILIYDALKADTYKIVSTSGGKIGYETSDENLLAENFDIYEVEGTVMQSSGISVDGKTKKGENTEETLKIVRIDDEQYISDIDMYDYIGRNTVVYYRQAEDKDPKTIIYREDYKKADKITEISSDDFVEFKDNRLKYEDGNKVKEIKVPVSTWVIKNGKSVRENTADAIRITKGTIRVIDIDNNSEADVLIIWEYKNIFIDRINTSDFQLYDKITNSDVVKLNDDDTIVRIVNSSGAQKSFSDIKANTLLTVYESDEYVKAVINSDPVSAVFFGLNEGEDEYKAELGKSESDRTWYDIDPDYYNTYIKGKYYVNNAGETIFTGDIKLSVGNSVTYYKDDAGKIGYFSGLNASAWTYGYLTKFWGEETGEDHAIVKIYTQNDEYKSFDCTEKVRVDGVPQIGSENVRTALKKDGTLAEGEDEIKGQLIRFKLNNDGKITDIDTAKFDSDKEDRLSLHYTGEMKNTYYLYHPQCFNENGKYTHFYTGATYKFVVPNYSELDTAEADDFNLISNFEDNVSYTFKTYRLDERGAVENAFVVFGGSASLSSRGPYLVGDVYKSSENDEIVIKADVYNIENAAMTTVIADDESAFKYKDITMGKGDIAYLQINSKGKVGAVTIYNDYSAMSEPDYVAVTGWKNVSGPRQTDTASDLLSAQLKSIDDGVYRCVYGTPLTEDAMSDANYADYSWASRCDVSSLLIFDGKNVTKGTASELVPATFTGANDAPAYWFAIRYARIKGAVVYK